MFIQSDTRGQAYVPGLDGCVAYMNTGGQLF